MMWRCETLTLEILEVNYSPTMLFYISENLSANCGKKNNVVNKRDTKISSSYKYDVVDLYNVMYFLYIFV